eukprot:759813-Hanusia_phi.AAC.1
MGAATRLAVTPPVGAAAQWVGVLPATQASSESPVGVSACRVNFAAMAGPQSTSLAPDDFMSDEASRDKVSLQGLVSLVTCCRTVFALSAHI